MSRTCKTNSSLEVRPLFFFGVKGHEGRSNDILFKPALPRRNGNLANVQQTLVFFGGDVQNFLHLMDQNNPMIQYQLWCLEAVAAKLSSDFPHHHIVIIKPSRIVFDDVSCFDNFVQGNFLGVPHHTYLYRGVLHLHKLLRELSRAIRRISPEDFLKMLLKREKEEDVMATENTPDLTMDENPCDIVWQYELMHTKKKRHLMKWQKKIRLDRYPLTLVAFSKGCVVLNQFLYEFHYARRLEPANQDSSFIDLIKAMYWLDGGHPGHYNVYLTAPGMLKTLTDLGIEVHCHVSPYQVQDLARPWINKQWKEFIHILKSFNAKLITHRHLTHTIDLRSHFNLLLTFKRVEQCSPMCPDSPPPTPRAAPHPARVNAGTQSTPPAAPEQSPTHRNSNSDVIGLAIVSSQTTPYLGMQFILRKPPNNLNRSASAQNVNAPSTSDQNPSDSTDQTLASAQSVSSFFARNPSDSLDNFTYIPETPVTSARFASTFQNLSGSANTSAAPLSFSSFAAQNFEYVVQNPSSNQHPSTSQNPSGSAAHTSASDENILPYFAQFRSSSAQNLNYVAQNPSTSTQNPSTSTQNPSTSTQNPSTSTQNPSTSTQNPSTSTQNPSTSTQNPSTSTQNPSTSTQNPSTSTQNPSTSTQNPSTSTQNPSTSTQNPSTSTQNPSTSTQNPSISTQNPSTSTQNPSTSAPNPSAARRSALPRCANELTVLFSKPCCQVNFNEDLEAAEAFKSRKYYKLETPVVVLPSENQSERTATVYAPVNEVYTPTVLNSDRLGTVVTDSTIADTPQPRQSSFPPRNFWATLTNAPNIVTQTAARATQSASTARAAPVTVQRANNTQVYSRVQSNSAQAASSNRSRVTTSNRSRTTTSNSSQARSSNSSQAGPSNSSQAAAGASISQRPEAAPRASTTQGTQTPPVDDQSASQPMIVRRNRRPRIHGSETPYSCLGRNVGNHYNLRSNR